MRAAVPVESGQVESHGVSVTYEVFGSGSRTLMLMPTWCIVHSRIWKMQVPYLARHFRVITWDGPGNGVADRPLAAEAYTPEAHARLAVAVLEATSSPSAILAASSGGTNRTLSLAADHPDRVDGIVFVGPYTALSPESDPDIAGAFATGDRDHFADVFMTAAFNEPHSTKAVEDGIGWARETTMEVLLTAWVADGQADLDAYRSMCSSISCPVLIVQGSDDRLTPESHGRALADAIGSNASLLLVEGGGHRTDVRDPVRFGLLVRDFVDRVVPVPSPERRWVRATSRPRRALFLSSPIGLGHAQRDVAIARELRALHPGLQIDWLAQDPVSRLLEIEGESVHEASRFLVNESAHMTSESAEHDLHCFQAWRRMDEILTANFMVVHDLVEQEHYDLIVGDEAWETDHFLHENPELKRSGFAWLTDFVGWLPMPGGGEHERVLAADYNLEMIEHIDRYRRIRDRSIFVGDPDDIVPDDFGPGLPSIRTWTEQHFDFAGYVTGFEPVDDAGRARLREELGFRPDEKVCVVAVGGSGVGGALLQKVADAVPVARQKVPELRVVAVAGPRIDPQLLDRDVAGLDVHGYVPHLYRHLAACDVAVVQGGLTTAMELTANRRPFLYFPLGDHFEQRVHVPHRLRRYRAGRQMEYSLTDPDDIAAALLEEVDRAVDYIPVASDGAARAAALLADLV
jgi:pimeloyl-ACP methyl ester carboxylesterase/predicted glycosyltransferase